MENKKYYPPMPEEVPDAPDDCNAVVQVRSGNSNLDQKVVVQVPCPFFGKCVYFYYNSLPDRYAIVVKGACKHWLNLV